MKSILKFDFDKEGLDDEYRFKDAINGSKCRIVMWKLNNWLMS